MTKEQMMDKMIRKYGFEDVYTLYFCAVCEDCDITATRIVFYWLYD